MRGDIFYKTLMKISGKKMNYIQCVCSCIYSNYCFQIKLEFRHDGFFGIGIKAKQENSAARASAKTNDKMNLYDTVFRIQIWATDFT